MKDPILIESTSVYFKSSSSLSQKNLNPPSPPVLTHLKAMSTRSPSHELRQSIGLTKLMLGAYLRAFNGNLNEFSSVMNVTKSSKSAKLGAWNTTAKVSAMPGATSPLSSEGNLAFLKVNTSVAGGMNLMRLETLEVLVTFTAISYTPLTW